jgi:hypothetical protein
MPTRLRDATDANFDPLNNSKNKYLMVYESSSNSFVMASSDTVISVATTSPTPQDFITQLEEEIDPNNIAFSGLDAGTF